MSPVCDILFDMIINTDALMLEQHFTVVAAQGGASCSFNYLVYSLVQWFLQRGLRDCLRTGPRIPEMTDEEGKRKAKFCYTNLFSIFVFLVIYWIIIPL